MSSDDTILAYTPAQPVYPPYFNITKINNNYAKVTVRESGWRHDGDDFCGTAVSMIIPLDILEQLIVDAYRKMRYE